MGGKQMEGDPQQRRQAAREAREAGSTPSAEGATTGASGQRHHVGRGSDEDKLAARSRGKQTEPVHHGDRRPGTPHD